MRILSATLALSFICSSLVGCSSATKKSPDQPPSPGYVTRGNGSFKLHPYKEVVLENGLKVFFVHDNSLPRVSFTLMVRAGSLNEGDEMPGLNALTAYMLEQGTQSRNAMKLADEFGQLGSSVDISPSADATTVYADALSSGSQTLLELFSDVVMNPSFAAAEITRIRAQMLAGLQKKIDNPSSFADDKMNQFVFGKHPYGRDTNGTPEGLKAIGKQDIIKHYLTFYRPNNSSLAVVGSFGADYENRVREVFGKWTKRTIPEVAVEAPVAAESLQVKLIVKKGLQQTQIRIGQLGIARDHADYLPLRLANEVVGGSFASRLNQKVRDDLGLTYSIQSYFDVRKQRGSFDVATFTKNETAARAMEEALKVLTDFAAGGANDAEVAAGRSQLIGQFPRAIETSDRLAYNLLALDFYGIPASYLTDFNKNVAAIKTKEANTAFVRAIDPGKFRVLIYGDEKIIPQFEKYKPVIERVK